MKTPSIIAIRLLTLSAFALGSIAAAMADDKTPPIPIDQQNLKAERKPARHANVHSLPLGDYPTRPGDPGYRPKLTPAEREAAAQKAATESEKRQNGLRWQATP